MAKVFTGKVVIPGDRINEYLKVLEEAEKAREPFRQYTESLNKEFGNYMAQKFSPKTIRKHIGIVEMFIEFLARHTDVERFEDVTKGIANTHFRNWYKRKVLDSSTPNDLKVALSKFFQFLSSEKGIINKKVLKSLK